MLVAMDILMAARRLKHQGLVERRRVKRGYVASRNVAFTVYDALVPYTFRPERHRDRFGNLPRMYFLDRPSPPGTETNRAVPHCIYALWTGDNELTAGRKLGLSSLRITNGDDVISLVTRENLADFIVKDSPLHPAYRFLSLNHRSDYLRAYLMHHHGGGYSDIKPCRNSWDPAFQQIQRDETLWVVGYQEVGSDRCGGRDPRLGHEIRRRYRSLVGFGAFICRPNTPLTAEWLREVNRRMDYYSGALAECPGDTWGENPGYPIGWIELGFDIFNPLQLKYLQHIGQNHCVLPQLNDHR